MSAHGLTWGALAIAAYTQKLGRSDPASYKANINSIPKELVHRILSFVPESFDLDPSASMTDIHRLRGVCYLWREIVLNNPFFFSKILVDFKKRPEHIQEWLSRSRQDVLTIFFSLGCDGERVAPAYRLILKLIDILAPCIPRCKKISFHANSAFAAGLLFNVLMKLNAGSVPVIHVVADDDDTLHLPKMFTATTAIVRHIVAQRCALGVLPSSLTFFKLVDIAATLQLTATQVRNALSGALSLRELVLHRVTIQYDIVPRVLLPSLTTLDICASTREEALILKVIELPELLELELELDESVIFDVAAESLSHGSKVQMLSLAITSSTLGRMRDFFRTVPRLRCLTVSGSDEAIETTIGMVVLTSADVFPLIERMQFGDELDDDLLPCMFSAVAARSPQVKLISPVSDVVHNHRQMQCMFLRDGKVVKERRCVVNGDFWDV
ncbi:hypothetical protein R3P38DRAFT_3219133 [Favolaschia claudopus]|uniref:F-box domain-containing protein n=1 Tax=Favolaschia claudopus TaxID=2862362 RepID=A0AAW0A2C8_9AGAR